MELLILFNRCWKLSRNFVYSLQFIGHKENNDLSMIAAVGIFRETMLIVLDFSWIEIVLYYSIKV